MEIRNRSLGKPSQKGSDGKVVRGEGISDLAVGFLSNPRTAAGQDVS